MAGLRERRHIQTRNDIVEVALALFQERGYSDVTMEEIAVAAGVSRSTAYRRFPTKEHVVLDVTSGWLDAFDEAADELPPDCSLADAFARTALAVAAHIDSDRGRVRATYVVLEQVPTLSSSGVANAVWLERMTMMADNYGALSPEQAAIAAGAYLGGLDAMMLSWVKSGGTGSVVAVTERLITQLEPLVRTAQGSC